MSIFFLNWLDEVSSLQKEKEKKKITRRRRRRCLIMSYILIILFLDCLFSFSRQSKESLFSQAVFFFCLYLVFITFSQPSVAQALSCSRHVICFLLSVCLLVQ